MKNIILIMSAVLLIFLALSCGKNKNSSEDPESSIDNKSGEEGILITKSQFESSGMLIGKLNEYEFTELIHTNGYIDVPPQNKASISTLFPGYVKSSPFIEGDKIKKGQLIFTLVNSDYLQIQQEYIESCQQIKYLEAEYQRQKVLSKDNIASQKIFMKAEGDFEIIKAKHEVLKQKLLLLNINPSRVEAGDMVSEINIYSPIDGYVTAQNIIPGMFVSPSDVIMEIINPEHFHLELSVFEKDVIKIKVGQEILFWIQEGSKEPFRGEVILIGKLIEGDERTVKIHGHIIDDEKAPFIVGMYVEADIVVNKRKSHGLPSEAVINYGDRHFIFVKSTEKDDKIFFVKKAVVVGQISEDLTEILGEHDTSNILIKGAFNMAGNSQ